MKRVARRSVPQPMTFWQRQSLAMKPLEFAVAPMSKASANADQWPRAVERPGLVSHPLADAEQTAGLRRRADDIEAAFGRIEPTLKALAQRQFDETFSYSARSQIRESLGLEVPESFFATHWARPLDVRRLYARCVLGTFCRLVSQNFDRDHARMSDGEQAAELIARWGFHALDITPCADGRLSGVVDYILRIPPSVIAYRKSYAGALFDVEESLRHWEAVELRRWREGIPNRADAPTRFLKIAVYHFSSVDPAHEGCAAHQSDTARAAGALKERLHQLSEAVQRTHCCGASIATLLVGVDTDTDAIRVHVPDAAGLIDVDRYVDNRDLYGRTQGLPRDEAKDVIREAVAHCAGVPFDHGATEGMRWLCGYLLKNNIAQIDAVRAWHGQGYSDHGHTERLIIVGDAVDDVQLRNLAFQAQMETVEEGAADLDVGIAILRKLHSVRRLAVPVLVHLRFDPRIPGARERAELRALRLMAAIRSRYRDLAAAGELYVQAVVRAGEGATIADVAEGEE